MLYVSVMPLVALSLLVAENHEVEIVLKSPPAVDADLQVYVLEDVMGVDTFLVTPVGAVPKLRLHTTRFPTLSDGNRGRPRNGATIS